MSLAIEPFTIAVPDAELDDLRARLARTRLSQQLPDAGWDYGTERGYLAELVAYWFKNHGIETMFYWYVSACIAVSLIVFLKMRETSKTSVIEAQRIAAGSSG